MQLDSIMPSRTAVQTQQRRGQPVLGSNDQHAGATSGQSVVLYWRVASVELFSTLALADARLAPALLTMRAVPVTRVAMRRVGKTIADAATASEVVLAMIGPPGLRIGCSGFLSSRSSLVEVTTGWKSPIRQ